MDFPQKLKGIKVGGGVCCKEEVQWDGEKNNGGIIIRLYYTYSHIVSHICEHSTPQKGLIPVKQVL